MLRRGLRLPAGYPRRVAERAGPRAGSPTFVAIDFETAGYQPDSACAVAVVRVEGGQVVRREVRLLRPPRQEVLFSHLHGITWATVAHKETFVQSWPSLAELLEGAQFLAAHNAAFDRGVLSACCAAAGLEAPALPFVCTVRLARRVWGIYPTRLPDVCARLGLPLHHHNALSDAEACAGIVVAALRQGARF
ncbi:MAG: exonuclease [Dehalococcoidia bacterium]|nr:exonuclease [Dehalococcoidia bacterium]